MANTQCARPIIQLYNISTIVKYIRSFYSNTFNSIYFLLVCCLLALIIYFNYYHSLEYNITHFINGPFGSFTGHYILLLLSFVTAYLLQLFFYKDRSFIYEKWFWIILFTAPAIFAFRMNFNVIYPLIRQIWTGDELLFWMRCLKWFFGPVAALIPVYFIWKIKDSSTMAFYGNKKLDDIKPYLIMIALMIPLIILAATQADFLKMYPRAQFVSQHDLFPRSLYYFLHELFYSMDFITIEFFFRGFLIISMIKICGPNCIIPAACFYCCIHLGKPMGEAISSFLGGLLLGIISYNTKSIRGGLMVHLGIAWLMEIAGFISHYIQNTQQHV